MWVVVPVTISGTVSAATVKSGGLWNIVKRIQLSVADGSANRNQTDCSGAGLIRRAARITNGLDLNTIQGSAAALSDLAATPGNLTGTFYISYPLFFKHPQLSDPIGSALMLPLPRYNSNPTLTVQFGASTDCFSTLTGGTISIGTPYLVINKRQVDNISFPVLDTEVAEISTPFASTGTNLLTELQVPGSYTMIDIYTTTTAGVAQDISGGPGNPWTLQFLGNTLRQFNLQDVQMIQQHAQGNAMDLFNPAGTTLATQGQLLIPGYYHLDFLNDEVGMEVGELGSVLNTNLLAGSGSRLQLLQTINTAGTVSLLWERIFGDLSPYKFNFMTAAG